MWVSLVMGVHFDFWLEPWSKVHVLGPEGRKWESECSIVIDRTGLGGDRWASWAGRHAGHQAVWTNAVHRITAWARLEYPSGTFRVITVKWAEALWSFGCEKPGPTWFWSWGLMAILTWGEITWGFQLTARGSFVSLAGNEWSKFNSFHFLPPLGSSTSPAIPQPSCSHPAAMIISYQNQGDESHAPNISQYLIHPKPNEFSLRSIQSRVHLMGLSYWIILGDLGGWDYTLLSDFYGWGWWFTALVSSKKRAVSEAQAPAADSGCHGVSKAVFNNQRVPSGKLT